MLHNYAGFYSALRFFVCMKFRSLEGATVSDAAFEAFGKTKKQLFENAALATFEEMADTKKLRCTIQKKIAVHGADLEHALYQFLAEIIARKDSESLVFAKSRAKIEKNKKGFLVRAVLFGDPAENLSGRILRKDVKAVTWHLFKIEKNKKGFKATVALDI